MKFIGIDIGSTCAKTVVMNENKEIVLEFVQPTGWSSVDTAEEIRKKLVENDADPAENVCVATGYGRVSVPYADKMITEITCHAMGAVWIFDNKDMTIIDMAMNGVGCRASARIMGVGLNTVLRHLKNSGRSR